MASARAGPSDRDIARMKGAASQISWRKGMVTGFCTMPFRWQLSIA
jgi:hypothetical protein